RPRPRATTSPPQAPSAHWPCPPAARPMPPPQHPPEAASAVLDIRDDCPLLPPGFDLSQTILPVLAVPTTAELPSPPYSQHHFFARLGDCRVRSGVKLTCQL